jgi:adenylate cyclase
MVQVRGTLQAQFKGLEQPITLYDISGIGGMYHLSLPDKPLEPLAPLIPALLLACFPIDGKVVSQTAIPGHLTGLAGATAEGILEGQVAAYSNVKLVFTTPDGQPLPEVYAKILTVTPVDTRTSQVRLEFTSLPTSAKAFLARTGQTPSTAAADPHNPV